MELQQARLLRAVYSRRQLYEVMVDFWSNHFNIFAAKGADRWLATSYDRDTIRPHALGRFSDLLRATAQSPAMLYLDNWLSASPAAAFGRLAPNNPRRGLNENYARELMELHTLGVDGGYTQRDVQEVARCFTGWTIRQPRSAGEFYFEPRIHDSGEKIVIGRRIAAGGGISDGLAVLDMLARHPSTARFISLKLARRFVSDDPPTSIVDKATAAFRQTDGDIAAVLRVIFEGPEFFAPATFQAKVKKPLEYVASALRATGAQVEISHQLLRYLARMGEPLFLAQPPTGYPDAAGSWASPDMLLTRINFAGDLVDGRIPGSRVRPELIQEKESIARLIAPEGLPEATKSALAEARGPQSIALLLGAPEFQGGSMKFSRRQFLRSTGLGFLALGLPPSFLVRAAHAQTGRNKTLVVVFQRGAMDGLNAVVPFKDPAYYALRPTIAIAEPAAGETRLVDLDGFYGLHPALAPLKPIYDRGQLAIVHAAGSPIIPAPTLTRRITWRSVRRELRGLRTAG